jgi:hypothetical protein
MFQPSLSPNSVSSHTWSTPRSVQSPCQLPLAHPLTPSIQPIEAQRYDLERSLYYKYFLSEMLKSIYEDGVNVVGALAWTIQ